MAVGVAVSVGLDRVDPDAYARWSGELRSSEQDAEDLAEMAVNQGFAATVLRGSEARADGLRNGLMDAGKRLRSGDFLFLAYSGYGGELSGRRVPSAAQGERAWALYDRLVPMAELAQLLIQFEAGVRVLIVADTSTGSGTVNRAVFMPELTGVLAGLAGRIDEEYPRDKHVPHYVVEAAYVAQRDTFDELYAAERDWGNPGASVLVFAASTDNQFAWDGPRNSVFTDAFLRVWKRGRFVGSYLRFLEALQAAMPPTQTPQLTWLSEPDDLFLGQQPLSL
jgi:metacaspase-1